jgi:UDP:flavonoid glycosyltransferase YjiC (YdhE family)
VVDYVDQESVLAEAIIFISRGGMASIHEAIASQTPLLVIPEILEQQLTAQKVESLKIGKQLSAVQLTKNKLLDAIEQLLSNVNLYTNNIKALIAGQPQISPASLAATIIEEYYLSHLRCER